MKEDERSPIPIDAKIADILAFNPESTGEPDYSPTVRAGMPAGIDGELVIGFEKDPPSKKLKFSITNKSGNFYRRNYDNTKHTVQIPKPAPGQAPRPVKLRITLSDQLAWTFPWPTVGNNEDRQELAPIRFTGETDGHAHWQYYTVHKGADSDTSFVIEATQTGPDPQTHPFNLYVLIEQFNGGKIPVVFDPDMDNPPK